MKLTIKLSDLLKQLPRDIRYALIAGSDGLPESFVFDATEAPPDIREKLESEYPLVRKVLTTMQWIFFCEIVRGKNGADTNQLLRFVETSNAATYTTHSNSVAVHIKAIRSKIREFKLPFEVETVRGSRHIPGRYKINSLV